MLPVPSSSRSPVTGASASDGRSGSSVVPVRRACGSTASTASANAASKTRSNGARSSCRLTSVIRADQYRSRTRTGGTTASASVNAAAEVIPTSTPRVRSRCTRAATKAARSTPASSVGTGQPNA